MKGFKKILVGALLVVTTQLYAQPTDPTVAPDPAQPVVPGVSAKLSPVEMSQRATELEAMVRADDRHVLHLQALARKDKDVIKLTCVNDKYVRLKAESNVFDAQKRDLLSSLEKDSRVTTFDSMAVAADGVHKAREEAERCMGEPELGDSDSKNSFTPPDITDDPTKGLSFDTPGSVFEPPAYASPWS
jgi:hypothetical protein